MDKKIKALYYSPPPKKGCGRLLSALQSGNVLHEHQCKYTVFLPYGTAANSYPNSVYSDNSIKRDESNIFMLPVRTVLIGFQILMNVG